MQLINGSSSWYFKRQTIFVFCWASSHSGGLDCNAIGEELNDWVLWKSPVANPREQKICTWPRTASQHFLGPGSDCLEEPLITWAPPQQICKGTAHTQEQHLNEIQVTLNENTAHTQEQHLSEIQITLNENASWQVQNGRRSINYNPKQGSKNKVNFNILL